MTAATRPTTPPHPYRAFKKSLAPLKNPGGLLKTAKIEAPAVVEFRIWCESCCIRVAPTEERTVVRGKTYHPRCYSKLSRKPKAAIA
jgi:hypothetical protein